MKIEPGYWRCRNGSKARVLCTDAPGNWPVVGYVRCRGNTIAITWDDEGRVYSNTSHEFDLIEPWVDEQEPEKPIEVTLSQLRAAVNRAVGLARDDKTFGVDEVLAEVGISVPCLPTAKQPVRVSGWVRLYPNGLTSGIWDTEEEALDSMTVQVKAVYVTGTEGVGPTEGEE